MFDKTNMEELVPKLSSFSDCMKELLNQAQIETLAIQQTCTEFQILQLNNNNNNIQNLRTVSGSLPLASSKVFLIAAAFSAFCSPASSNTLRLFDHAHVK
jgi:hypothetical protein